MTKPDQTNSSNSFQDDRIDTRELFGLLWKGKILIIIVTAVFYLGSIYYASSLEDYYKSKASMSLLKQSSSTSISGLSSLAGISLAQVSVKGPQYINTITSRAFLKKLISVDENVLPSIMAVESYDSESKKLVFNSDIYDSGNKKWKTTIPSHLQAYGEYMSLVSISYHQERQMIDIFVEHRSPIFAKEFLDLIIREADNMLREIDLKQSSEALAYLSSELPKTQVLDIKNAMNQLILSQLHTQVMAKIGSNYIINIVDPPYIPIYTSKPSRSFIRMVGLLGGLVAGILLTLMRYYFPHYVSKPTSGT